MVDLLDSIKSFFVNLFTREEEGVSINKADIDTAKPSLFKYLVISWLVFNWKVLYALFFVGEEFVKELKGITRLEYAIFFLKTYPKDILADVYLYNFGFPFLVTFLIFFIFNHISYTFFDRSLKNKKEIERIKKREYIEDLDTEDRVKNKEKKVSENNPEILWQNEVRYFFDKESSLFSENIEAINAAKNIIYGNNSMTHIRTGPGQYDRRISSSALSILDSNSLIKIDNQNTQSLKDEKIYFTEKGKFFVNYFNSLSR